MMSGFSEYDSYDAVGLAGLVRRKEVSPLELLHEAAARCDRVNPVLNAVIYRMDAEAAKAAGGTDPSRPLAGVPFLAKDLGSPLAGAPLTSGSRLFAHNVPAEDGELMQRFKSAGLNIFGKTNVPEFGLVPYTESELFGPCRNPWDTGRTPGGSSGGAASAVAAGIIPMAHASDGGGSIRIPASCCGLFGLKPSRGLTPRVAQASTITEDFGVDHVVSRSVRDSAAALDAICNRPNPDFLATLDHSPERLRIGVVRSAMFGNGVTPEIRAALGRAINLLQGLGHEAEDAEPEVDYAQFRLAFLTYWTVSIRQILDQAAETLGRAATRGDIEYATWGLANVGGAMTDGDKSRARRTIWNAAKAFAAFFERYDILVSPVLAQPPLRIGQNRITAIEKAAMHITDTLRAPWLMKALLRAIAAKSFAFASFTAPFNMTGQPAMSVPLYWTPDGLPIGIQFAAKLGADGLLLRLARQLEIAQGWVSRIPPAWSGERVREAV
jgi:Asp-tRNA(Asn)/Glu-tRNA(Gln) amidotransferase A subunit family amidase